MIRTANNFEQKNLEMGFSTTQGQPQENGISQNSAFQNDNSYWQEYYQTADKKEEFNNMIKLLQMGNLQSVDTSMKQTQSVESRPLENQTLTQYQIQPVMQGYYTQTYKKQEFNNPSETSRSPSAETSIQQNGASENGNTHWQKYYQTMGKEEEFNKVVKLLQTGQLQSVDTLIKQIQSDEPRPLENQTMQSQVQPAMQGYYTETYKKEEFNNPSETSRSPSAETSIQQNGASENGNTHCQKMDKEKEEEFNNLIKLLQMDQLQAINPFRKQIQLNELKLQDYQTMQPKMQPAMRYQSAGSSSRFIPIAIPSTSKTYPCAYYTNNHKYTKNNVIINYAKGNYRNANNYYHRNLGPYTKFGKKTNNVINNNSRFTKNNYQNAKNNKYKYVKTSTNSEQKTSNVQSQDKKTTEEQQKNVKPKLEASNWKEWKENQKKLVGSNC